MKIPQNGSIVIPILNNEYKVVVCWGDVKYIGKVQKDWHHEQADVARDMDKRRGVCFYHSEGHPVIALPRFPKTPDEIATLAHEATHAIDNIFNKLGETVRDEVFAHSIGAVVRSVLSYGKK